MFIAGLLAFAATSLACALAPSAAFLIVARAAQGLSAAVLAPAALSLLTTTFAEGAERNRALGLFGAATAAGFVAGQILGGVLTDLAGWRTHLHHQRPGRSAGCARRCAGGPRRSGSGRPAGTGHRRRCPHHRRDGPSGLGARQGSDRGWTSADFLVPLAAAVILAAAFVITESRRADPLIRLSMLRSRWMAGTSAATAVTGALNGVVVLLCTLFLQHAHGYSPLQAGLAFVPTGIAGLAAGTRLAGPLVTRFGVRTVLTASLLASAIGVTGLSLLQGGGSYLPLLPWLVIIGAAFTTAAVATTVAVSAGVVPGEQGMAAAIRQTAFQLGVALSVAVLLSVAASYTATRLSGAHPQSTESALTNGYRLALAIAAVLAAVGAAVAAAALRPARPRGQHPQAEAPHQPQAPALPDKAPASAPGPGHENGAASGD